ncbi:uncharacterized protein LOC102673807 [Apis dorsata]|uniref:uncharacterized protein LOC102673807 n=1 Tax=Apis dorsata TaxID=7462 RepID=UPI0012936888|nr:uncharacterized protein LOC102673807 [Apis dorsata]
MDIFQKTRNKCINIFDIPYYKLLEKYMKFLGQDPRQRDGFRNIIVITMVTSISGILIPTSLELYTSLCDKNMDAVIECLPHLIAAATSVVKLLNIHFNRENFKKLFEFIIKEWEKFELNNQFHVLEEITIKGSKMAQLYRNTLLSFMVLFLLVPLIFPLLDIIHPLNETRPRQQLFRVNYLIFNHNDYFFYIYLQLAWGSIIVVMIIVTIDSLYMIIIHHSSGMFAMCGYKVQEATRYPNLFNDRIISENYTYEQLKNCITIHDKALQFYNILNESSRNSYLIQVGLNMMGISVTAVQTVVNLDKPEEAIRTAVFLGAEQFHLFVISLPGQVLLDHCTELANNIKQQCSVLQKSNEQEYNVFDIEYYKTLKLYLTICGINPYQNNNISIIIIVMIISVCMSFLCPTSIQLWEAISNKDFDNIIQNIPQVITVIISMIKILNIYSNKMQFKKLFYSLAQDWKSLESKEELIMLHKFTQYGSKLALLYRRSLLTFLVIFLSLPLCNPILDVILPLNETRPRQNIFNVNYIILDNYEYFYIVYMHLSCSAAIIVIIIISVDSLYISIIYHACGLFAACGYQIQKLTKVHTIKKNGPNISNIDYEEFKQCVIMHYKCLQLYDVLEKCCRNLYLIQMGLNIMIISVTCVEVVVFLDRPEEAIRAVIYVIAQQFHLYAISLPGETLLNQSSKLADKIYDSEWYKIPMKVQKVLHIMQIRSNKPCILTAAGLYEMKIESFGITIKTCMSYFMMFLSLRE